MKLNFPAGVSQHIDRGGILRHNTGEVVDISMDRVDEFIKAGFTEAEPRPVLDPSTTTINAEGEQKISMGDNDGNANQ